MQIEKIMDRSNYFKGLLLLTRKDNIVQPSEKEMMLKLGNVLGFDKKFCETAINELLENENILDEPPKFSNLLIARYFIKDGLKLAFVDHDLDPNELQWLREISSVNNLPEDWFENELESARNDEKLDKHDLNISKHLKLFNEG